MVRMSSCRIGFSGRQKLRCMMCESSAFLVGRYTTFIGTTVPRMRVAISIVVKCPPIMMAPRPLASAAVRLSKPCTWASLCTRSSLLHQVLAVSHSAIPKLWQWRSTRSAWSCGDRAGMHSWILRRAMRTYASGSLRMSLPRADPTCLCAENGRNSMARSTTNPAQVAQYLGRKNSRRSAQAPPPSTLPPEPHSIWQMYSSLQRLRSLRHGFWYAVSERIRWSRGAFEETPARELCIVHRAQSQRIAALRDRYQVQFELRMSAAPSVNNYEYPTIRDRAA